MNQSKAYAGVLGVLIKTQVLQVGQFLTLVLCQNVIQLDAIKKSHDHESRCSWPPGWLWRGSIILNMNNLLVSNII